MTIDSELITNVLTLQILISVEPLDADGRINRTKKFGYNLGFR